MARMERLTKVFDRAWEDLIYDRCTELPTLMDIDDIDAKWIAYLKPLLGFTEDISLPADTTELRRILKQAAAFWAQKPTEEAAVLFAIRMVTGNRFRAANWFDFRMQTDQTVITEELEDFDPYVLDFPTTKFLGNTLSVYSPSPDINFAIGDLPFSGFSAGQFSWLVVKDSAKSPTNDGIYEIDWLTVNGISGKIIGLFPNPNESNLTWELLGYAEEYVTEVRLVDQGVGVLKYRDLIAAFGVGETVWGVNTNANGYITAIDTTTNELTLSRIHGRFEDNENLTDTGGGEGTVARKLTGVLNRELLRILVDLARPFGERIDIVYINFLDQFLTPEDLDQWTVTGTVTVPSPGGYALIADGDSMVDADPYRADWGDQVTAWKFYVDAADTDAIAEFRFFVQDATNYYYVLVDYNAMDVELWKMVAGSPTQIGSSVPLAILKAGVSEVVRVDALAEGSDTRIRVKIAGDLRIDEADSPAAFTAGGIGAAANNKDLYLEMAEVNVLPCEIDRVGPLP